jgi:hypothetical protein
LYKTVVEPDDSTDPAKALNPPERDAAAEEYPLPRRAIDVFLAPGRLFEHFRTRTPWAGPLLIAVAVGLLIVMLIPQEMFVEQARQSLREAAGSGAALPDPETVAGFARVAGAAGVVFGTPITAFAVAGVLALLFSILGGGEARYVQYLAVTTHTMLITSLGGLVTLPVQILTRDLGTRLSLGLLVPFLEPGSFAARLLNGIDVFALWALVVAALGVAVLNRRTGWAAAAAVLGGIYVVLLAGVAALAG